MTRYIKSCLSTQKSILVLIHFSKGKIILFYVLWGKKSSVLFKNTKNDQKNFQNLFLLNIPMWVYNTNFESGTHFWGVLEMKRDKKSFIKTRFLQIVRDRKLKWKIFQTKVVPRKILLKKCSYHFCNLTQFLNAFI